MLIEIKYFSSSKKGICASDLTDNKTQKTTINSNFISSLSGLKKFNLPLSGHFVDFYALLIMLSGEHYYLRHDSHSELLKKLSTKTMNETEALQLLETAVKDNLKHPSEDPYINNTVYDGYISFVLIAIQKAYEKGLNIESKKHK